MEKMQVHEYVEGLEEERRKIQVFHRELPLCLQLVTQAIEACRRQVSLGTAEASENKSECSEQTTSAGPVLEEFMPIKRSTDGSDDDDGDVRRQSRKDDDEENDKKKSDWLRSVQLWNETPDPAPKVDLPRKTPLTEMKRNGGGFQPFRKEKSVGKTGASVGKSPSSVPPTATSSTAGTVSGGSKREEKDGQGQRKQRRCWSPELHRRFLNSLQQLGGSHAATPKQIRELMKVDGLTNDEVKSHLQKYRLHTRRPSPTIPNNANPQAPQFVVVGSIWVQPPEYTAAAAAAASGEAGSVAAANKIYSPVAAPPRLQQKQQPERSHSGSHSEGGVHSNSSATSSSTHTTTASPEF